MLPYGLRTLVHIYKGGWLPPLYSHFPASNNPKKLERRDTSKPFRPRPGGSEKPCPDKEDPHKEENKASWRDPPVG